MIKYCPKCGEGAEDREYVAGNEHLETVICPNCCAEVPYDELQKAEVPHLGGIVVSLQLRKLNKGEDKT